MKIIIAGAGAAGLAAATWLTKLGHDVEVFEATDRAGGRAKIAKRPQSEDLFDVGTQYFHSNYKRARSLLRDCGLHKDLYMINGPTRFFDNRKKSGSFLVHHWFPYIASGSVWDNIRLIFSGGWQMLRHPINPYAVGNYDYIDKKSAKELVPNEFEWEYNARALISVGSLVEPDQVEEKQSYLQVLRLMRIIVPTNYLSLNHGMPAFHEAMASKLTVHYDTPISSLIMKDEKVGGVVTAKGETIEADYTILAMPPSATSAILPADWVAEQEFLQSISHPPMMVVTLFLDRALKTKVWSYVFREETDKLVSFCVDGAKRNPNMAPSGKAALQAWICYPACEKLAPMSDDEITATVAAELQEHFPDIQNQIEHSHVQRHAQSVPQAKPGHNAAARSFLEQVDQRDGIEFCGDYFSGGYLECALWSSERAVSRITGAKGFY